jgi:hypothetical protein
MAEKHSGDLKRSKNHAKKAKGEKGEWNGTGWDDVGFNHRGDGDGGERHDGTDSFENSPGLSREDAGNSQGAETW